MAVISMYLKKTPIGDRIHLSAVHGYRDNSTKKVRSRTIKTFGYLDEFINQYPDPIEHFKSVVEQMNKEESDNKLPSSITFDRSE